MEKKLYDKKRREIHVGDILKVYHYTARLRRERVYMYKQVVSIVQLNPNSDARFFFISHLSMDDKGYYMHLDGTVMEDVEIVQSIDAFNDNPSDRVKKS